MGPRSHEPKPRCPAMKKATFSPFPRMGMSFTPSLKLLVDVIINITNLKI